MRVLMHIIAATAGHSERKSVALPTPRSVVHRQGPICEKWGRFGLT